MNCKAYIKSMMYYRTTEWCIDTLAALYDLIGRDMQDPYSKPDKWDLLIKLVDLGSEMKLITPAEDFTLLNLINLGMTGE